MSRIFLVRHGESEWHAENRFAGRTDIDLTAKGMAQGERLALWAAGAELTSVWSSPLRRARMTAEAAARTSGLPLGIDERLVELDFGRAEGLTAAEMRVAFPAERAAFEVDPVRNPLPGGEDPELAAERGVAALQEIAARGMQGRSLVVAHSTLLRLVLCRLLRVSLSQYRTLFPDIANGTLTELDLSAERVSLHSFNVPIDPK